MSEKLPSTVKKQNQNLISSLWQIYRPSQVFAHQDPVLPDKPGGHKALQKFKQLKGLLKTTF